MKLGKNAKKIYTFLQEKYIKEGYCFSGSVSINSLMEVLGTFDFNILNQTLTELEEADIIQKGTHDTLTIELTISERKTLIEQHNLSEVWLNDKTACSFDPTSKDGEITRVMENNNNPN